MKIRFLLLVLVLFLLPVAALAAIEPSDGVGRVGQTVTLSARYEEYTISGAEASVSIIVESGVKRLILDGAKITAPNDQNALTANGSLELRLIGASTIVGGSSYLNGGKGIVLPSDGKLTFCGDGRLKVSGGDSLYENEEGAIDGTGGTAIVGSVIVQDSARVTAEGGDAESGYWEENAAGGNGIDGNAEIHAGRLDANGGSAMWADSRNNGGHGVNGSAVVHGGQLNAAGGEGAKGRRANRGGNGVNGRAEVNGGQLNADGGSASESGSTYYIDNFGGHGVGGDAEVNGGSLNAAGGSASGGQFTSSGTSKNKGGHGINGSAVIHGGRLIAVGSPASLSPNENAGGNGVNGAFTAAGGYALATGGEGDAGAMGKAAAATNALPVTIGSSGKLLIAGMGEGASPEEPLNNGEFYTAAVNETNNVSGKRSLETKEYFAVAYSCAFDGCGDSCTDYAEGGQSYTVKTPESLGFQDHGLAFAGFVDANGNAVGSLIVSRPLVLTAAWKVVFVFEPGSEGAGSMPPINVITSSGRVCLPECTMTAPAGYQFAGWMIDGEGKIYAEGDKVPAAGEIRLTAVWKPLPALPDTGDSGMPTLWALLCLGSCIMLLLLRTKARN